MSYNLLKRTPFIFSLFKGNTMNQYIGIEIPNKDCKGIFLFCETNLKKSHL